MLGARRKSHVHLIKNFSGEFFEFLLFDCFRDEKQIDLAEQLESVAYVLCGDDNISLDKFCQIFQAKGVRRVDIDELTPQIYSSIYYTSLRVNISLNILRMSKNYLTCASMNKFNDLIIQQHLSKYVSLNSCVTAVSVRRLNTHFNFVG